MERPSIDDRLHSLLEALLEDGLDDGGREELAEILRGSSGARDTYRRFISVHTALEWVYAPQSQEPVQPKTCGTENAVLSAAVRSPSPVSTPARQVVPRFPNVLTKTINWRTRRARLVAAATVLAFIASVGFYLFALRPAMLPRFVAKLHQAVDAEWGRQDAAPVLGARLRQGRSLELTAGFAEIHFDSGAAVVLEGPAKFKLNDENAGSLESGKLAARVPEQAVGFEVEAPYARITDLGTQFGVEVVEGRDSQVDVFDGKVVVESSGDGLRRSVRLTGGEATRILPGGLMGGKVAADRTRFATEIPSVRFFTDRSRWLRVVGEAEHLRLDGAGLTRAEEVTSPPQVDQNLGPELTFRAADTGLSRTFRLKMLQSGNTDTHGLVFSDVEGRRVWRALAGTISIGNADEFEDDDWEIEVLDNADALAIAVILKGNNEVTGESFSAYGPEGELLGRFKRIPPRNADGETFLGVVSDTPIRRIVFDEDAARDDIGLSDAMFSRLRSETTSQENTK